MINRHTSLKIRKIHRYLGLFLGIQFLLWTVSGMYFSWTNINKIHGNHFKKIPVTKVRFDSLISPSKLHLTEGIYTISLKEIGGNPYYFINNKKLYNAKTGTLKTGITKKEALLIAKRYIKDSMKVATVSLIKKVSPKHEYRERLLPAYVISYIGKDNLKAYISQRDGQFQTVRHKQWRWFDFLWMTHTMDYKNRDNINTITLRVFSLLGLITVMSGFLLWFVTSPTVRKILKNIN